MMDAFFNQHLRQHIDTSVRPWRRRSSGESRIELANSTLRTFERTERDTQTFFASAVFNHQSDSI